MRITHFETFQTLIGERKNYLFSYFDAIKDIDRDQDTPLEESLFDRILSVDTCANLFGTPNLDRSTRIQRKMDLAVIRHMYHLWKDKNYFDITQELYNRLKDTDLKDVDIFFLRTPFRSMYINLPKGNGLFVPNNQTGLHEVESIYLLMDDYKEPQNITIPSKDLTINGATKHMHMLVCGETKGVYGDAVMFYDLIFQDGKISEALEKNKEILENPSLWPQAIEVFNFTLKILLYINCANASIRKEAGLDLEAKLRGLKNPTKQRKLIQRYSKISPQAHSILDVVIDHGQDTSGASDSSTHSYVPKGLERVRRHFKTQRYGTGLSMAKIIWVEAYSRREGAEVYREKKTFKVV